MLRGPEGETTVEPTAGYPLAPGVPGTISSIPHPAGHAGIDIVSGGALELRAPVTGTVVAVGDYAGERAGSIRGYTGEGTPIYDRTTFITIVAADTGHVLLLLHQSNDVDVGQKVTAGDRIGTIGDWGSAGATHIHLQIFEPGTVIPAGGVPIGHGLDPVDAKPLAP